MHRQIIVVAFALTMIIPTATSRAQTGLALNGSALTSFYANDTYPEHVFYEGASGQVYEMWSDSGGDWHKNDLTQLANGTAAQPGSGLTAFYPGGSSYSEHVFFVDGQGHVHELFLNGSSWQDSDITKSSNGTAAAEFSALTSFYEGGSYPKHVFFEDNNQHVHEMWSDSSGGWHDNDLTVLSGFSSATAESGSAMTGFYTGSSENVFFESFDGYLNRLELGSTGWEDIDFDATGAMPAAGLTSFYVSGNNTQYVFFEDSSGHVYEQYSGGQNSGTNEENLTGEAAGNLDSILAINNSGLTSFYANSTYPNHVFYEDVNAHVHEIWSSSGGGWTDYNLTTKANGTPLGVGSRLTGFYEGGSYPEHVFFEDSNNHVHEMWSDSSGGWHDSDLTQLTN